MVENLESSSRITANEIVMKFDALIEELLESN